MARINDLKTEYNEIVDKLNVLKEENGKAEEVKEFLAKANTLKEEIKNLEEIRNLEIEEILNDENKKVINGGDKMTYNNGILNKLLLNKATPEERAIYNEAITGIQVEGTQADGGYLVPKEQHNEFLKYRRTLNPLDNFVKVMKVKRPTGSMPAQVESNGKLVPVNELAKIAATKEAFKEVTYSCAKYGDLMGISEELLADTDFDILGYLKEAIALKSVRTNNEKVITKLKTITSPKEIAKKSDLASGLTKAIYSLDPVFRGQGAIIVTNTDGLEALDQLTDTTGRPLLTESLANPGVKYFKGLPVIEVSNAELASVDTNKTPYFIGSMNDFLIKVERQGLEIAGDASSGFMYGAYMIRAIERFDYIIADTKAMTYVKADLSK